MARDWLFAQKKTRVLPMHAVAIFNGSTTVGLRNPTQVLRKSPHYVLFVHLPRKDSSAAVVRWTELMFRRMRSLTLEVVFEEKD